MCGVSDLQLDLGSVHHMTEPEDRLQALADLIEILRWIRSTDTELTEAQCAELEELVLRSAEPAGHA